MLVDEVGVGGHEQASKVCSDKECDSNCIAARLEADKPDSSQTQQHIVLPKLEITDTGEEWSCHPEGVAAEASAVS